MVDLIFVERFPLFSQRTSREGICVIVVSQHWKKQLEKYDRVGVF